MDRDGGEPFLCGLFLLLPRQVSFFVSEFFPECPIQHGDTLVIGLVLTRAFDIISAGAHMDEDT
eukprot:5384428-Pyramimonas_sp.AAC.1